MTLRDSDGERLTADCSKVCMTLCSSSGTWLNGCLQKQTYYVSLTITDPDRKNVCRVGLSFEQAARMLMYNGEVECTLERYRGTDGKQKVEEVVPPETVHQRMVDRMGKTHNSLLKRLEDAKRDVYDMLNGNKPKGKKALEGLMHDIDVIKSYMKSNQTFVVQQAEEEVSHIQSNAVEQLGVFIESKGLDAPKDLLTKMIPVSNQPLLTDKKAVPVDDDYTMKKRDKKKISDMTAMEVGKTLNNIFKFVEEEQRDLPEDDRQLFMASAGHRGKRHVSVNYINYQGETKLSLENARSYLRYLGQFDKTNIAANFKTHYGVI